MLKNTHDNQRFCTLKLNNQPRCDSRKSQFAPPIINMKKLGGAYEYWTTIDPEECDSIAQSEEEAKQGATK